jgi:SAM-dependent methyltransferase
LSVRFRSRAFDLARGVAKSLVRRRVSVTFGDLERTEPVSDRLGYERGTPIDRYYIEDFLRRRADSITGRVMEVGDARYAKMFGRAVERVDVLHATAGNLEATIVGDLTAPSTLPAESVDCVICTQTLGFIFDVAKAIEGLHKIVRPGGTVLATVSGISQISRYDMDRWGDFWRFTDASVRELFGRVFGEAVRVTTYGNVTAAMAFLQGLALEDLPDRKVLDLNDPDYQLIVAVAATKRADAPPRRM